MSSLPGIFQDLPGVFQEGARGAHGAGMPEDAALPLSPTHEIWQLCSASFSLSSTPELLSPELGEE